MSRDLVTLVNLLHTTELIILRRFIGIMIGHYNDPYEPINILLNVIRVLNLAPVLHTCRQLLAFNPMGVFHGHMMHMWCVRLSASSQHFSNFWPWASSGFEDRTPARSWEKLTCDGDRYPKILATKEVTI